MPRNLTPDYDERIVVARNPEGVFSFTTFNAARKVYHTFFMSTQEALDLRDGLDKIINEDTRHVVRVKLS
jgi:hypothetical protein